MLEILKLSPTAVTLRRCEGLYHSDGVTAYAPSPFEIYNYNWGLRRYDPPEHAMLLTSHEIHQLEETPFWGLQNSHGLNTGDRGFLRLAEETCLIAEFVELRLPDVTFVPRVLRLRPGMLTPSHSDPLAVFQAAATRSLERGTNLGSIDKVRDFVGEHMSLRGIEFHTAESPEAISLSLKASKGIVEGSSHVMFATGRKPNTKVGDFEMNLKRKIGEATNPIPVADISPTVAPPIPSEPMNKSVSAAPSPSQTKPASAKVSPFLNDSYGKSSKLAASARDETQTNTQEIAGTRGYMSPEYLYDGVFSDKSDVFSFGVLLLELLSGKRSYKFMNSNGDTSLLAWVINPLGRNRVMKVIDS